MATRVAINGFGRIGRNVARALVTRNDHDLELVAINDLASPKANAMLFQRDSVHGPFPGSVSVDGDDLVIDGKKARKASVQEVAERTLRVLKRTVPAAIPGIAFLSGGQTTEEATAHLSAMNAMGPLPWTLTFSYGRALQTEALEAWGGRPENIAAGKRAFSHRAKMCSLAARGQWKKDMEKAA